MWNFAISLFLLFLFRGVFDTINDSAFGAYNRIYLVKLGWLEFIMNKIVNFRAATEMNSFSFLYLINNKFDYLH